MLNLVVLFYMVGRDKSRTYWRVLKIDRSEPSELNINEDSTTYTESECCDLLRRIHEGNRSTGGLKFVTSCYGIIGFIKFLGPYYMLLITKRRQIGAICGHNIYSVCKSEIIPLPNSTAWENTVNSKIENRYKKLLCMVDLTKDFFFSYSYHVMRSLQKNTCENDAGKVLYETMFVWNEFLSRGIRNVLQNTLWTVALVYGFFKQATLSISGRDFKLTLIARRSRHYAGTSYGRYRWNSELEEVLIQLSVQNEIESESREMEDVMKKNKLLASNSMLMVFFQKQYGSFGSRREEIWFISFPMQPQLFIDDDDRIPSSSPAAGPVLAPIDCLTLQLSSLRLSVTINYVTEGRDSRFAYGWTMLSDTSSADDGRRHHLESFLKCFGVDCLVFCMVYLLESTKREMVGLREKTFYEGYCGGLDCGCFLDGVLDMILVKHSRAKFIRITKPVSKEGNCFCYEHGNLQIFLINFICVGEYSNSDIGCGGFVYNLHYMEKVLTLSDEDVWHRSSWNLWVLNIPFELMSSRPELIGHSIKIADFLDPVMHVWCHLTSYDSLYLKRGVNEKGRVANDVETEQIVFEDVPEGCPMQISSVVQNRGSIPLFWSQETSRLNLKPDIILSRKDQNYEATRLHFENLAKRYGNPVIILNLIKTHEKKPRESILRAEFANAIEFINKDLSEENRLKFLHWDLHKHSRSKATNVLVLLGKVAAYALTLTGFFYSQVTPVLGSERCLTWNCSENVAAADHSPTRDCDIDLEENGDNEDVDSLVVNLHGANNVANGNHCLNASMFQKGVLRTNCIDCLDRTNVAQYAYGLAALGKQLRALGVLDTTKIDIDDPIADQLMWFYERMGDTLAHQYGGSAAHNKIVRKMVGISWHTTPVEVERVRAGATERSSLELGLNLYGLVAQRRSWLRRPVVEAAYGHDGRRPGTVEVRGRRYCWCFILGEFHSIDKVLVVKEKYLEFISWKGILPAIFSQRRGQWKAATQSQEFFRTLQRYYSNAYMDAEKQNAINVFLGYFQPQEGKPELWELDSDQNYNAWKAKLDDYQRSLFKRSLSDGNILRERSSPMSSTNMKKDLTNSAFSNDESQGGSKILSESSPEISTCESGVTISRYTSSAPRRQLFVDMHRERWLDNDQGDACSNFVDLDWLSSSGNSCDEELYERSMLMSSPIVGRSSENVINGIMGDRAPSTSEYGSSMKGREHTGTDLSYGDVQDFEVLEEFSDSFVRWGEHIEHRGTGGKREWKEACGEGIPFAGLFPRRAN
ncbi:hypothetical protein RHSIM_Rhsim05G0002000 [Rhododendron simsii]|uniref:SAC domain-containing protein n=1 Tax=Rhododendron simsii TaxID=118357 RepID=A0A834LLL5_RHOSS|nr:hypothetical protein RHSIM_Rhsim05G0002000 [Rhododendron simsii]